MLFCNHYFSPLNTFMRKGKDPDPGGPKTCGSGSGAGSGSPTLVLTNSRADGVWGGQKIIKWNRYCL